MLRYLNKIFRKNIMVNKFHKKVIYTFCIFLLEILLIIHYPALRTILVGAIILEILGITFLPMHSNKKRKYDKDKIPNSIDNFIKLENGYVRYKFSGDKKNPTIILINGFPMPYEIWGKNINELVESNYNVLQFDLYGFGFSDFPNERINTDLYCKEIYELIKEFKIKGSINIIAFSVGCAIATEFINKSNNLDFGKIIFIGPMVNSVNISPFNWPIIGEYFTCIFMENAIKNIFYGNFNKYDNLESLKKIFFDQLKLKHFNKAWLSFYRNVFSKTNFSSYEKMSSLDYFAHIISGKNDKTVSIRDSSLLNEKLNWPLTLVHNGGHSVQYECCQEVNSIIKKILQEEN